jgi:adenylate kinase family enzyme
MDIVLVGLPGSGKSVVGKRLANRHAATFIDLDERIERADGRPIRRSSLRTAKRRSGGSNVMPSRRSALPTPTGSSIA